MTGSMYTSTSKSPSSFETPKDGAQSASLGHRSQHWEMTYSSDVTIQEAEMRRFLLDSEVVATDDVECLVPKTSAYINLGERSTLCVFSHLCSVGAPDQTE
jgi:hypothetical protein